MTHSLHRLGSYDSLKNDFTVGVYPLKGVNADGSLDKIKKILKLLYDCGAINISAARRTETFRGNILQSSIEDIIEGYRDGSPVYAAFDNPDSLKNFLIKIKEADFGLSVIVQGLCDRIGDIIEEVGLDVHTTNHSLGIWGKNEKLPPRHLLEVTTMCGHGLVSPYLVEDLAEKVKTGVISADDGATELAKGCICGIFNPTRAKELLTKIADG